MKLSFCSIAFRKSREPLSAIIPILAAIGYEGVEIWANHLQGDGSDLDEITAALAANNLAVPIISPYFNITGNDEAWDESLKSARWCFDYANALGAPLVRTFTGFLGSDEVYEDLWREAIARLGHLCDMAADAKIALALETHPKTLVDTVPAIHRLLADVDRVNLVLNLDIYHLWERHQDPEWILTELRPHIRHIHAKNAVIPPGKGDEYPLFHDKQGKQEILDVTYIETGNMDYGPFIESLRASDFSDWLSVEWFGPDPAGAARHEYDWLHKRLKVGPKTLRSVKIR